MSIYFENKKIYLDGKPTLVQAGEIHYYRLKQSEWQKRIDELKSAGLNAVASYIPWVLHEEVENQFDFTGKTHEELDLVKFLDLIKANDLYFIARPGPFIMAEMKNDGIPYWVREKYPHLIPSTWDENKATTVTLDYLNEDFLNASKKWYQKIIPVLSQYDNLIACQLDNEIGMLSWVSNNPDLTDTVLEAFKTYILNQYDKPEEIYPFIHQTFDIFKQKIRKPEESYIVHLHHDLGQYMRIRTGRYVTYLKKYAKVYGLKEIPFLINIHGTGGGRAFTYPIGISQLYRSYQNDPDIISGSDVYFDDLTVPRLVDSYMVNILTDCVNGKDQPLTSLEFNAGSNDFGNDFGGRIKAATNNLRVRLYFAQGNRLLNFYLFSGGENYRFSKKRHDGNDRIATTGEKHGYAAPIEPNGKRSYLYDKLSEATNLFNTYRYKLASQKVIYDKISFAFIPDYYMTEFKYPRSEKMREIYGNIEKNRSGYAWDSVARALLLLNYQFDAVNIQDDPISLERTKVLILPSSLYMAQNVQEKVVNFLKNGGKVLLYGEVPLYDLKDEKCSILADELGITFHKIITSEHLRYIPSVYGSDFLEGIIEYHIHDNHAYHLRKGKPILKLYDTEETVGFDIKVGEGRLIGITCSYPNHLPLYKRILDTFEIYPNISHTDHYHGTYVLRTQNEVDEQFIHIFNLDDIKKEIYIKENKKGLFEGNTIHIEENDGILLPIDMLLQHAHISYATNEIIHYDDCSITFRLSGPKMVCKLKTEKKIKPGAFSLQEKDGFTYIIKDKRYYDERTLTLCFEQEEK